MGVDVVDVLGVEPGVGQGLAHAGDRAPALVVAVGDPEGVGGRAVADDLAVDRAPRGPWRARALRGRACPAPSPRMKPSRSRSNGRLARVGSSLRVERAVRRLNPVTPNGWIMLCVPPESITSASPRRIDLGRLADRLRAGGAGGQAVGVRPPGAEEAGEVAGGRARLLLGLADRVQLLDAPAGEGRRCRPCRPALDVGWTRLDEPGEVLLPLARAEVDAEPRAVEAPVVVQARSGRSPSGRRRWRTGCSGSTRPSARRRRCSRRGRKSAGLGGDPGREGRGVEQA